MKVKYIEGTIAVMFPFVFCEYKYITMFTITPNTIIIIFFILSGYFQ